MYQHPRTITNASSEVGRTCRAWSATLVAGTGAIMLADGTTLAVAAGFTTANDAGLGNRFDNGNVFIADAGGTWLIWENR